MSSERLIALLAASLAGSALAQAESNIMPDHQSAWGANLGWVNWRPDDTSGAQIGPRVCRGWIYSPNVGWISLGHRPDGSSPPYSNSSSSDFGVNVSPTGQLRGYAYGANIGWINLEEQGGPRVDLTSGRMEGAIYGANVGWISLRGAAFYVAIEASSAGPDSDGDGIPDRWENIYSGDLNSLNANGDLDGDGQSDLQEYVAGTNPTDPNERLRILQLAPSADGFDAVISWTSKPTRVYQIEARSGFDTAESWVDVGLGPQSSDGEVTTRTVRAGLNAGFFRVRAVKPLGQ